MKINEKVLASYASSSLPADLEGWLLKRGEVNRAFQKRWCVLRGNLLFYSEKPGDKEPLGVIILEGCTVELAEDETEVFAFKLVFHSEGRTGRTYVLGTSSQTELESWMKLLACASYDYMKLMVVELQQQVADIEARERLVAADQNGGRGAEPRPPPRARHNPFNAGKEKAVRYTWQDLHQACGERLLQHRAAWLRSKDQETAAMPQAAIAMKDDNLLVIL